MAINSIKELLDNQEREIFLNNQKISGYRSGLLPKKLNNQYLQLFKNIMYLPPNRLQELTSITEEKLRFITQEFYKKYFKLHDIQILDNKNSYQNSIADIANRSKTFEQVTGSIGTLSPFYLPIHYLHTDDPMTAITEKGIIYGDNLESPIIFEGISLCNNLSLLSIPLYTHEISHTQTESTPGYAEDYHNKEVISIFLEKVAALELDSTNHLLHLIEKMRYRSLQENIKALNSFHNGDPTISFTAATESSMYIESTLKAEKLFDIYQNARKPKEKVRILSAIQNIFDGQMTVEELLQKNQVTAAKGADLSLTRRHLSK